MNKPQKPSNSWVSHLPKEKQEEFSKRLLVSKDLFKRLTELLDTMSKDNIKSRVDKNSYDKPAWSEFQADANGFERAIMQVQQLLKFTKE